MNDKEFGDVWTTLEPTPRQRRRIDARVFPWLDAHDTGLLAEWLALFRVTPLPAFGLVMVSAISILAAVPFAWFARVLM